MRWRPVVLGGAMTAVGVVGTAVGGVAGWLVSPGAFMIAAAGATLALLGVGLIRDARRPRGRHRPQDVAGGALYVGPTGDVGTDYSYRDYGRDDPAGDRSGAGSGGGWWGGGDSGGGWWGGGDSGGGWSGGGGGGGDSGGGGGSY
ncbi:hypothetical protein [Micromonospora echinaurantiaca]|uniref:hypothetical protein n=1 Tax=Micromonospora echinaurantiaca TaxID=47857 RepID=UPI0034214AAA